MHVLPPAQRTVTVATSNAVLHCKTQEDHSKPNRTAIQTTPKRGARVGWRLQNTPRLGDQVRMNLANHSQQH
eukprot:609574-Amphidinium_carterae.1